MEFTSITFQGSGSRIRCYDRLVGVLIESFVRTAHLEAHVPNKISDAWRQHGQVWADELGNRRVLRGGFIVQCLRKI